MYHSELFLIFIILLNNNWNNSKLFHWRILIKYVFFVISLVVPKIVPFTFGDSPIFAGQSTQITCLISEGDSPINITWVFDGSDKIKSLGVSTMGGPKVSMLFIDSVDSRHTGNYTCIATNKAGSVEYTTVLGVHGIN